MVAVSAAFLFTSCSSIVVDGVSLAKHPEIQRAQSVAISQSPELLYLKTSEEKFRVLWIETKAGLHRLPGEAVAGSLLNKLPPGMKGKLIPFEPPTQNPRTTVQRLLNDHTIDFKSVAPRKDADLIIVLVPSPDYSSSGYYNPASGAYISGGSSSGGHSVSLVSIGSSNVYSRLDALVFSGVDGHKIAKTSVIALLQFKELTEAYPVVDMCSKSLAKSIFGVR